MATKVVLQQLRSRHLLKPFFTASSLRVYRRTFSSDNLEEAKKRVALLTEDPGNDVKLRMYALYKQATIGKCNTKKPGVFDFVGQAKWSAWNEMGDVSKEEAEKQYIELVDQLAGRCCFYSFRFFSKKKRSEEDAEKQYIELVDQLAGSSANASDQQGEETDGTDGGNQVEGLDITKVDGVCTIRFNRPKKLNAITTAMYDGIRDALNESANDASVKVTVITGTGDFYCSGNDLSNFTQIPKEGPKKLAADSRERMKTFVQAFINYPKLLVCAVNGPAIGISVTVMALCDLVYASEKATFHTPFMTLGQSPEGCSSYTFPKIMGYARANDILIGGRKLTAREAFDRGLVTDVIPDSEFQLTIKEKIKYLAGLPPKSVMYTKALNRTREKDMLNQVNEEEAARLEERWLSEECMNAVMAFLAKRK